MSYLRAVQRGVDFVEANLDHDIACAEVARQAGLSQWHFQRIFKALTNETLKDYLRARRFSLALNRLRTSNMRVIDIAMSSGFESQASFTRAFKAAFGVTPARYRRSEHVPRFSTKLKLDNAYLRHLHSGVSHEPSLYWQPAMQLVGLVTRFYGPESEKNNLGTKLPRLWDSFLKRSAEVPNAVPGLFYGVLTHTAAQDGELQYCACLEVSQRGAVPRGMDTVKVPASRYAQFTHRGLPQALDQTVNYVYSSWLLKSQAKPGIGPDLEVYGDEYRPNSEQSVVHYAVPIATRRTSKNSS